MTYLSDKRVINPKKPDFTYPHHVVFQEPCDLVNVFGCNVLVYQCGSVFLRFHKFVEIFSL